MRRQKSLRRTKAQRARELRRRRARTFATEPVVLESLERRLLFTAAVIASVSPLENSHAAAISTDITATYDQNIDGATVNDQTFAVHAMQTGRIVNPPHGSAISVVGDTITFNPDNDFKPGETIQVIATDGIDNLLAEPSPPRVWTFRAATSGGGDFVDSAQELGDHNSRGAVLGDLDGDGDLDAFVANTGQGNRVWINDGKDHGDAPDTFGTLLSSDGARHLASVPRLGSSRDVDTDGQPTAGADGDDNAAVDDEDGVAFAPTIIAGDLSANVTVNSSGAALLDAWIDFNGDGTFAGASERIFASQPVVAGNNNLTFIVPADARQGSTFGRFRISTTGNLGPRGPATDGEVEDYLMTIANSPGIGQFIDNGQNLGTQQSRGSALGDLDGDGDLDAYVATTFLRDASGSTTAAPTSPTADRAWAITIAAAVWSSAMWTATAIWMSS